MGLRTELKHNQVLRSDGVTLKGKRSRYYQRWDSKKGPQNLISHSGFGGCVSSQLFKVTEQKVPGSLARKRHGSAVRPRHRAVSWAGVRGAERGSRAGRGRQRLPRSPPHRAVTEEAFPKGAPGRPQRPKESSPGTPGWRPVETGRAFRSTAHQRLLAPRAP